MKEKSTRIKRMHEFVGRINGKVEAKDYNTEELIYRLTIGGNEDLNEIKVYQRKVTPEIWEDIENNNYIEKKYLFRCEKIGKSYHLKDWKELN